MTAGENEGWNVFKINLKASGSGGPAEDVKSVTIFHGYNVIFSGQFAEGSTQLEAPLSPIISVAPGGTVSLMVKYEFSWDPATYLTTHNETFVLKTGAVTAKPWDHDEGLISGQAKSDTTTICRVKNLAGHGFFSIQKAITHSTTNEFDILTCSDGTYEENIQASTSLTLRSRHGRDLTIIRSPHESGYSNGVIHVSAQTFSIDGFKILEGQYGLTTTQGFSHKITIKNCYFNLMELDGIRLVNVNNFSIYNTRVRNCMNGLALIDCIDGEIKNDTLTSNVVGIFAKNVSDITANGCELAFNKHQGLASEGFFNLYDSFIYHNGSAGIQIGLFGTNVQKAAYSYIRGNTIVYNALGILIDAGYVGNKILSNIIENNKNIGEDIPTSWEKYLGSGLVVLDGSVNNNICQNLLQKNKYGIVLAPNTKDNRVWSNKFVENGRAIWLIRDNNYIQSNVLQSNTASTGIHLTGSTSTVINNQISDDAGDGIVCEEEANPLIENNNIFDNTGFGLNNQDPSVTVNANGNWWGSATGPSGSDISGQVSISSWLDAPVSLTTAVCSDTVFVTAGAADSVSVFFQNFQYPDDVIDLTVSDVNGWLTAPVDTTLAMTDSLGQDISLQLYLPAGTASDTNEWIHFTAVSQTDVSDSLSDSLLVQVYGPALQRIVISPDSAVITPGTSVQFTAAGFDQNDRFYQITPVWSATGGSIDDNGLFTSGADTGWLSVTAEDTATHIKDSANIYISTTTGVEDNTATTPTTFSLDQNYPNPFNPSTVIRYHVKEPCRVTLKVFDLRGRELRTLKDSYQTAGKYQVEFKSNSLPSGIYFYKIEMGSFRDVKKMVKMQ
ncbi:MAG: T9SS type A sorting domain-containing protein [Actinobacteria bacterium]|nr:T9SS type A sorting domain-containing protein [Actinomycetota bacterium]